MWESNGWLPWLASALAVSVAAFVLVRLAPRLTRQREELAGLRADLAKAHAAHQELERLNQELFANVSHELRAPLTLVLGPAERLLANNSLSRDQRSDLELITRNARTLLRNVNALLDVAKLDAGQLDVDWQRTDLAIRVRDGLRHFEGLAKEHDVKVVLDVPPAPLLVELDAEKIDRVLLNVLANAFKYAPNGGTVRAALLTSGDHARLEIADSGPGIPENERPRMFERFARGGAAARPGFGSTGLGLAIVKDLLTLHRGTITVGAADLGGASFVIELPLRAPEAATVRDASGAPASTMVKLAAVVDDVRAARSAEPALQASGRATVLLVEDDREMHAFVAEILSRDYRVEHAFDGAQGIALARSLRPDAILTDLQLPDQSGEALVAAVREDGALAEMPIVLLSAQADEAVRRRLLHAGAQDFVVKPFSPEELLARLGNLVALAKVRIARDRAAEASALKTSFLGLVSHELRTPLTSMQLLVDRLTDKTDELPARHQQIVERLGAATTRLTAIVDTLLQYARIQGGYVEPDIEPFDLGALALEALEEVRPEAKRKSLTLSMEPAVGRVMLESDPKLVRIILVNLLSNAVKFTDAGTISVGVARAGDRRLVRIIDTGPGIAHEAQNRIFEPFAQLEPTKHKHLPGIGLGLSLVRQIVDNLHAQVHVRSEVGEGSTFEVSFPATR